MSAGIVGTLNYDKEIFSVISGTGLTGVNGIYIYADKSAVISFHVSQYAPAGTYAIDVTVLDAYDGEGRKYENVLISPVQVTVAERSAEEDHGRPEEAPAEPAADGAGLGGTPENPVLATVRGEPITRSDCDEMIAQYAQQGTSWTYAHAVEQLKFNHVIENVIREEGYMDFTEEEVAAIREEMQSMWDSYIEQYVTMYLGEDTPEERERLRKEAEEKMAASGVTIDTLVESQKIAVGYERLEKALVPEDAVTEEMIQNAYMQTVEQHQAMVGEDPAMRELYYMYYGEVYYLPAGYRNVSHILLKVDDALLKAYSDAKTNYENLSKKLEEQQAAAEAAAAATEAPAAEAPVTEEQVEEARLAMEAAREAVLASKKAELDDIEARLAAGESFESLIAQYNEDPGLNPAVGYQVHEKSIMWDPAFKDAAFSEAMAAPGSHSLPVVGSYGIHVLYYMSDAEAGALPMTEEVRNQIKDSIRQQMVNEAAIKLYQEKAPSMEIIQDDALIEALDREKTESENDGEKQ